MQDMTEHELIAHSLQHNAQAYAVLVERYKDAIYYHCFAIVRDEDQAEDIAQESFISAYYKLDQFDQSRKFSTWLFKIATNNALTHIKRSKRTVNASEEQLESIVSPHTTPHRSAEHDELHRAIAKLSPRDQAIISLHYWQGLNFKEIAETLSKPEGSIKVWILRAKEQLRKELG